MKSARLAILYLLCGVLLLETGFSTAQRTTESDVQSLKQLETVWNQAHLNGDAETLGKLWADDLKVDVPRMPEMSKSDSLSFARSGRMKFLRYETSDIEVRVYGDAAVVTGRLRRTRSMNGRETDDDWRFTKVYVREAKQWRVVSFHASEAPQ